MTIVLHRTNRNADAAASHAAVRVLLAGRPHRRHERASLTLLGVRRIGYGRYWPHSKVANTFERARADNKVRSIWLRLVDTVVAGTRTREERERFVAAARRLGADQEGYVVAFPNGHRIKLKGEQYVTLHRGRDAYARETHVLKAVLSGGLDDLTAILDDEQAARVRDYGRAVLERLAATGRDIATRMRTVRNEHPTRKARAIA